jgi:muramoyltetrapeptide carboxypeptidase LdcA involved in peptidoglycan recycling
VLDPDALLRPKRLSPGDRVAAVSLSWGGPGAFPHRFAAGVSQLHSEFGLEVVPMPNALRDPEWLAANPRARADDLMEAFEDRSVAGVISSIGGDDSIRILPFVDLAVIRSNPKVFLGYSDTTVAHAACLRAGLTTFYGPAVMAGFAENGGVHEYLRRGVMHTLFDATEPLQWRENTDGWTVELLDWADPANQDRPRTLRETSGWRWHGDSRAEGPIVAACLEPLDWIRGTEWWPDLDAAVLAIETSEEQPPPVVVARFLRSLAAMGDLEKLQALLLGRPGGAELRPQDHLRYDEAVLRVVRGEAGREDLPVVTGVDFGHTDPTWTIPIGQPVIVDPERRVVELSRAGVI